MISIPTIYNKNLKNDRQTPSRSPLYKSNFSTMDNYSPLESIFNVIGGLPQGHDKPVKHALYNSVALFLLFISCAAAYAVYMILEPFFKPLIWAVLVGSALHPLKRLLRYKFQMWFENLSLTNTPIILGVVLLPVNIFNDVSEFIGENIWKHLKLIIYFGVSVPLLCALYHYTPKLIVTFTWQLLLCVWNTLNFILKNSSIKVISIIVIGYISLVVVLWKPQNNVKFHYASIIIWLMCSSSLAQQFGSFQVPVFVISQVIIFGGFFLEVYTIYDSMKNSGQPISVTESLLLAFHNKHEDNINSENVTKSSEEIKIKKNNVLTFKEEPETIGDSTLCQPNEKDPWSLELFEDKNIHIQEKETSTAPQEKQTSTAAQEKQTSTAPENDIKKVLRLQRSMSQPQFSSKPRKGSILKLGQQLNLKFPGNVDTETYGSTFYLYSILWACILMLLWKNIMLLLLLPLPILFYLIKHLGFYIGFWGYLHENLTAIFDIIVSWCQERHDALVPVPIRGIYHTAHKINQAIKVGIRESMDTVASIVVIFGLIIFLICASVFVVLQIYAEGIMLVQMTGNLINQTIVHNPELKQFLPPAWDDTMDSILDNAYQYGREGISRAIKAVMSGVDIGKSEKLEKQVLELWDRVYQNWMSSNDSNGPKVTQEAVRTSWETFVKDLQKSPELFNIDGIMDFGKQNVGTLMSLLESVWGILKGNISLIVGSMSTFLSVILGGGSAVLNFILNIVVFLTTLFYLLNSSGDLYKPVEILTNFSPTGRRIGHALEGAINGVFSASFKMAAFYGMWTWFIHNLFGVKIVYLPTAFATILGAVPFLGTYWACIPAVLDLWLSQERGISAILFAAFQFLPTSIVDTTIYKEIKGGGHPYLTGLAIAGGIFCLGVEGAIMGPMLLCGLYVAVNLSSSLFKESPRESLKSRSGEKQTVA